MSAFSGVLKRTKVSPRDLLAVIDHEVLTALFVIDAVVAQNGICTRSQLDRLSTAAGVIGSARDHAAALSLTFNDLKFPDYGER